MFVLASRRIVKIALSSSVHWRIPEALGEHDGGEFLI
jgi:hypothetical protein